MSPSGTISEAMVEALEWMLERDRRRYEDSESAQQFFRTANQKPLAALEAYRAGLSVPTPGTGGAETLDEAALFDKAVAAGRRKVIARKMVMEHGGYEEDTIGFIDLVEAITNALSDAALSSSPVGEMVLVPINPDYQHLARLATLWGYTMEETADSYAAFLEALPAPQGGR